MAAVAPVAGQDEAVVYMPPLKRWLATLMLMAATIVTVLDQTIATVVLPQMQATLSATPDTISWVLTSYVLAAAIATPMTGWLSGRFGRRRFFGATVLCFTIASVFCGLAVSLPMMVAARFVQGFFGAFVLPMTQAFLFDMNPPEHQIRALTIWGAGSTVAPVLGPVLGGYLTETFDWRWVFLINLPIGLITVVGIFAVIPKLPAVRRSFDHMGFILIAVTLCALQLALDRGTQQDWFDSTEIIIEFGLALGAFWMFIFHIRAARNPIIPPRLFRYRNYTAGIMVAGIIVPVVTAGMALLPQLLQLLLGYPVQLAGIVVMPRALTLVCSILLSGQLIKRMDPRLILFIGVLLVVASLQLHTSFNLQMDQDLVIWTGLLQGAGAGLIMAPTNIIVIASLPAELRTEGAAFYMLIRNMGTSVVIAIMSALLVHDLQVNHAEIGEGVKASGALIHFSSTAGGAYLAERIAALANSEITRQAMMIAFINDFWLLMWATICIIPIILFIKPVKVPGVEKTMIVD